MVFIKGNPKIGGRKKGTPNKCSSDTKCLITAFVGKELKNIDALLQQVEPDVRLMFLTKLLPYVLPKQQDVSVKQVEEVSNKYDNIDITDDMLIRAEAIFMAKQANGH